MFNRVQVSKQLSVSIQKFNKLSRTGLIPRGRHLTVDGIVHKVWTQQEVDQCKLVVDKLTAVGLLDL